MLSCRNSCQIDWIYKNQWGAYDLVSLVALIIYPDFFFFICATLTAWKVFFLVRIFPHFHWIRRYAKYLPVFIPNAGKYRPEKTPYSDTFHAVMGYVEVKLYREIQNRFNITTKNELMKNWKCMMTAKFFWM